MANNQLTGSIGPKMSPAAKKSLNEDPRKEIGPLDEIPLTEGPVKHETLDTYQPARYPIVGEDRFGKKIEMIREDR